MWNLLSNAVKFTPAGGRVTVDVGARDGHAELRGHRHRAWGSPPAFLPYVFDKFRQADGVVHARSTAGSGSAWRLRATWSSCTAARSKRGATGEGSGATFVVRLPLPPSRRRESPARRVQRPQAAWPTTYQSTMTEKGTPSIHATI